MRRSRVIVMLSLLLCMFYTTSMASNEGDVLMVQMKSGDLYKFHLSERPVVTFYPDGMKIVSSDFSAEYKDVQKIYFEEYTTDVSLPIDNQAKTVSFTYLDGQTVQIDGLKEHASIRVYALDGKSMPLHVDQQSNCVKLSLSAYPKGIYVIRCNKHSFKVTKR